MDNNKDIVFDINEALSFDGRTGPYIQNAHVTGQFDSEEGKRCKPSDLEPATFDYELTKHEIELIEQISRFPNAVQQAANEYRPLVMAAYAYDLANAFHSFYHAVPVLQSEEEEYEERPSASGRRRKADDCQCFAACSTSRRPRSCKNQAKRYLYV